MSHVAASAIALAWAAPKYVPLKEFITTQPDPVLAGAFFRMDRTVAGITELVVGPYAIDPTMVELNGPGKTVAEFFDAGHDTVQDVTVSWMFDKDLAADKDTPDKFFQSVRGQSDQADRIITLRWVYEIDSTTGAPAKYDEAKLVMGPRSRQIERGNMVLGNVTLRSGGGRADVVVA